MPKIFRYYKGTKAGGMKAALTNKALHGEDFYARIGKKGGHNGHTGGFAANPELAKIAGAKGGRKSKRGPAKKKHVIKIEDDPVVMKQERRKEEPSKSFWRKLYKKTHF